MVIVDINGKQYSFEKEGDTIETDYIKLEEGALYEDAKAMLYKDSSGHILVGKPYLDNFFVTATVVGEKRGDKITVVHYKPKKRIKRKIGYRSKISLLKIEKFGSK